MTKISIIYIVFTMIACSRYPADVERSLKLAGENRKELEKVLDHYGKLPKDKLKLQSAYFLIANLPYHYTIRDELMDSFKIYLKKNEPRERLWDSFMDLYGLVERKIEIEPDLYHITSEFLIRNIDFSFYLWNEMPWGKHLSFDDFCEDILPYRLSNEPLEYWKENYYEVFRPMIDTMSQHDRTDEICMKLFKQIKELGWNWESNFHSQGLGASILLEKKYGNCKEIAEFMTYIFRSLGIPSGVNIIIQHPDKLIQTHFWNYIRNNDGNLISVDYYYDYHTADEKKYVRKYGKVYQQCYAMQKESFPVKYKNKYIPFDGLKNFLLRDISCDYFPTTHITLRLDSPILLGKNDLAYLCVFNNREWIPITWSKAKNGLLKFNHVEQDILYQLRLIDEKRNIAASKPFVLIGNEHAHFLDADTINLQSMTLYRKFRLFQAVPTWAIRSVNGKFQGANQPDFSDSVTLHTIQKPADLCYVDVKLEHLGKFKYVRYLSAKGGFNNMAEIKFYSDGKQLYGQVIGTEGAKDTFYKSDKYSAFDNDPLTFFDALDADGAWTGLQFDKAYDIDALRYIFRNDDNNIRPGDNYELLYYCNGKWLSSGIQTADTTLLQYERVPSNTLYWLRNHSRGKEERPFTYKNGKQIWW